MDTGNDDLCRLCLQALTINDEAAGGTISEDEWHGTTALDISGFNYNCWQSSSHSGSRQKRFFDDGKAPDGAFAWTKPRRFYAGDQQERLVTLPKMLEISESVVGTCRFCSRLRALFEEQYAEYSWWSEPGSTLHFTIQYEWNERWQEHDGYVKNAIEPPMECLDSLAVLVIRPDKPRERDAYQFDILAWPGTCH